MSNNIKKMSDREKRRHSLSAKTVRSTVVSCILFGLIIQLVALSFYAYSFTKKYIEIAHAAAIQARSSAMHGSDVVSFSRNIMNIYNGLSDEDRAKIGTPEYRAFFEHQDMEKGGLYDVLVHMLDNVGTYDEIAYIYVGMFDPENKAIVYMVDTDKNPETKQMPGDWEPANVKGMQKLLNGTEDETLYYFDNTEKYGLLCTVAVPINDKADGSLVSFMFVDISIHNIIVGMGNLSFQLTIVFLVITFLLAWFQTKLIKTKLVEPINKIAEASQNYVKDRQEGIDNKEHFSNLNIHTKDELENLAVTMKDMEHDLSEYEANLTKIIAEKERIGTELSLATAIQSAMLPHIFPPFPDRTEFDIFATMEPAREVGGDFYDFFLIDNDHLCLVIADVSGKGIPAALFMMISKTILQSCAMLGQSAADILMKTNEALSTNNNVDMFVTAWVGILEISTGKLTAANAGHEYPILKQEGRPFELYKDKHGFVIGGMPGSKYKEYTVDLKPGDRIFVYTDGVPEANNKENKMFGTDRILVALNSNPDTSAEGLIKNVRASVGDFVKDAEQFDDLTMLSFTYNGTQKEA